MDKQIAVYPTTEYCLAIKGNEVPINTTAWMNVIIRLRERRHTQVTYSLIPFM